MLILRSFSSICLYSFLPASFSFLFNLLIRVSPSFHFSIPPNNLRDSSIVASAPMLNLWLQDPSSFSRVLCMLHLSTCSTFVNISSLPAVQPPVEDCVRRVCNEQYQPRFERGVLEPTLSSSVRLVVQRN